jgi:hypothetical protein
MPDRETRRGRWRRPQPSTHAPPGILPRLLAFAAKLSMRVVHRNALSTGESHADRAYALGGESLFARLYRVQSYSAIFSIDSVL